MCLRLLLEPACLPMPSITIHPVPAEGAAAMPVGMMQADADALCARLAFHPINLIAQGNLTHGCASFGLAVPLTPVSTSIAPCSVSAQS